jgi:hypothetical protein
MKSAFRIILALSFSIAACGHSKPELFLDQTTTALECGSASGGDCVTSDDADAGAPPEVDECYGDGDCEYGEVCERRHGVSRCQPEGGGHDDDYGYDDHDSASDDDDYDGHGGHDGSSDDDDYGHGGDDHPDGGSSACDPTYTADDVPKSSSTSSACHGDEEDRYEDRSGSNSGPH